MKKLVSILSATLLATSLAACGAEEEKVVEVPASTSTSTSIKSEARTKITIEQFEWDDNIACRPNPDGTFSAYWDGDQSRVTPEQKIGMWFVTTTSNRSRCK